MTWDVKSVGKPQTTTTITTQKLSLIIIIIIIRVFYPGQVFHCKRRNQGFSSAQSMSSTANAGKKVAVLLWINKYDSFAFLSALHSLFSIWTELRRYEKNPGAPSWRWEEWIRLTGSCGLHRNSPQGFKYQFHRGFRPDERSGNTNHPSPPIYNRRQKCFPFYFWKHWQWSNRGFFYSWLKKIHIINNFLWWNKTIDFISFCRAPKIIFM